MNWYTKYININFNFIYNLYFKSKEIGELLKNQTSEGKMIAAICAGPKVLALNDILLNSKITSYPTLKSELEKKYTYIDEDVVVDGNLFDYF